MTKISYPFRQNREILYCAWSDSKCYAKCSKWLHFRRLFRKILFYRELYPGPKLFSGKAFWKCNYLQNIFLIRFLITSQEPKKVRFLAVYTSSVRQAFQASTCTSWLSRKIEFLCTLLPQLKMYTTVHLHQ